MVTVTVCETRPLKEGHKPIPPLDLTSDLEENNTVRATESSFSQADTSPQPSL